MRRPDRGQRLAATQRAGDGRERSRAALADPLLPGRHDLTAWVSSGHHEVEAGVLKVADGCIGVVVVGGGEYLVGDNRRPVEVFRRRHDAPPGAGRVGSVDVVRASLDPVGEVAAGIERGEEVDVRGATRVEDAGLAELLVPCPERVLDVRRPCLRRPDVQEHRRPALTIAAHAESVVTAVRGTGRRTGDRPGGSPVSGS